MELRVARVLHGCQAEGPFRRTAIWVSGCSIRCPGCINPHLFEPTGDLFTIEDLAHACIESGDEGITLIGGEPFDQPEACAGLASIVREAGMGVITFSGFIVEDLRCGPPSWTDLLNATDLVVDGPYKASIPETNRALVGSANQRFVHLTERYEGLDLAGVPNRVEIRVDATGLTNLAGFLDRPTLRRLTNPGAQDEPAPS